MLILRCLLFFILFLPIAYAETIDTKKSELSAVNGKIESLEKNLILTQAQRTALERQLKTVELTIGKLSAELSQLTQELSVQKRILAELNATQQTIEATLTTQNNALAQQLRAAYQLGAQNQLKIILNQENVSAASRHLMYYKALNKARAELIDTIQQNLTALQKTISESLAHQKTLTRLIAKKAREQKREESVLTLRQQVVVRLKQKTQDKQQRIALLMANQKALQETITRLKQREITITGQPFETRQGTLSWPVKGPLIASYGGLWDMSNQRFNGMLIEAPMGTPVRAIYSGKIVFADWLRGFGLLIIINHGHNYMSLYGRNQSLYVKVGQTIHTGDVIAATGNSGGYDKPGLYFELRQNGTPLNPKIWCR